MCVIKGLERASVFARAAKCLIAACRRVPPFKMAVRRKKERKKEKYFPAILLLLFGRPAAYYSLILPPFCHARAPAS